MEVCFCAFNELRLFRRLVYEATPKSPSLFILLAEPKSGFRHGWASFARQPAVSASPRATIRTVDHRTAAPATACNRYGAAALSVITLAALIAYPLPFCIDCEYPNPWRHVSVNGRIPVSLWLLFAPFLAGALRVKRGWLVPVVAILALAATQPLGGVAWWSLRENEGPFILLLGLPITAACWGIGRLTRAIVTCIRHQAA